MRRRRQRRIAWEKAYGVTDIASGMPLRTGFTIDRHEDLIALVFTQLIPRDVRFDEEFQTLVYQALIR